MTDYVRVRVSRDGAPDIEHTTSTIRAEAEGWEVLEGKPTHDLGGQVLEDTRADGRPLKPKTSVEQAAAQRNDSAGQNTDNTPSSKEN